MRAGATRPEEERWNAEVAVHQASIARIGRCGDHRLPLKHPSGALSHAADPGMIRWQFVAQERRSDQGRPLNRIFAEERIVRLKLLQRVLDVLDHCRDIFFRQELKVHPHRRPGRHAQRSFRIELIGLHGQHLYRHRVGESGVCAPRPDLRALLREGVNPSQETPKRHCGAHHFGIGEIRGRVSSVHRQVHHKSASGRPVDIELRPLRNDAGIGAPIADTCGDGPAASTPLLIHHRFEEDVSSSSNAGLFQRAYHSRIGHQAALHIEGPQAVNAAALIGSRPGRPGPWGFPCRHRIHMAIEQQAFPAARSAEPCGQVLSSAI